MTAISRRLKDDGLSEMQAFELIGIMAAGSTAEAYKDQKRRKSPFRGFNHDSRSEKSKFDLNNFLEGD